MTSQFRIQNHAFSFYKCHVLQPQPVKIDHSSFIQPKKRQFIPQKYKNLYLVFFSFLQNFHFGFEQFPIPTLNRLLYVTFCACAAAGDELLCLCFADACADGDSFLIDCAAIQSF